MPDYDETQVVPTKGPGGGSELSRTLIVGQDREAANPTRFWNLRADANGFLHVAAPNARNTISEQTKAQSTTSQQLDFFGLFGQTRRMFTIYNNSAANMLIRLNNAASLTDWNFKIGPQCYWEMPVTWGMFSGTIHGIWDAAGSGDARIVEIF